MKVKILYIDDEMNNLISFKAAFRFHFQIFTAANSKEAVACLMDHPDIKVIFCDQRMPGETGVELFEQIRNLFPMPVRILITGYADIDAVIDAINKSHIFRYLKKPWKEEEVMDAVEKAVEHYNNNALIVQKNQELKAAYTELDKFAFSVSHDIRSPLAGLVSAVDFASTSENLEEIRELLGMMAKSLKQLDNYVIAMHEYYNQQKGKANPVPVDFAQLIEDIKHIYIVYADAGDIKFETSVVQKDKNFVSDVVTLKLILNNLLSNAMKYQRKDNPEKSVKLSIVVDSGVATVEVADNGIGIKEQELDRIFDLNYRATNDAQGFGFGLFNLKGALLKLKGIVDVKSTPGEGTTFKISIPGM